jgi:sugar/nucleoside kinase (ribokinase family)
MFDFLVAGNVNLETRLGAGSFPVDYEKLRFAPGGIADEVSGVGLNVSAALAALGHDVGLATVLGRDRLGDVIYGALREKSLRLEGVVRAMEDTMRTVVLSDTEGEEALYVDRKEISDVEYPPGLFRELAEQAGLVYIAHTFWTLPLGSLAKAAGKPVATDLQAIQRLDHFEARFAQLADIVLFSSERLAVDVPDAIRQLWDEFDVSVAVCGHGSKGATIGVRDGRLIQTVPAVHLRSVVSTTGAGDAMAAGFLSGMMTGHDPMTSLCRAQVFAGHQVGEGSASRGFLSREALDDACAAGRERLKSAV